MSKTTPYRATYTGGEDIDLPDGSLVTVLYLYTGDNDGPHGVAKICYAGPERDDLLDGEGIYEVCAGTLKGPLCAGSGVHSSGFGECLSCSAMAPSSSGPDDAMPEHEPTGITTTKNHDYIKHFKAGA